MTAEGVDSGAAPFSELAPLAPLAGPRVHHDGPWTARLWEQVLGALPLLLMGLLTALTWWLIKNTPTPDDAPADARASTAPDYTMRGFAVSSYGVDGSLRSRLEGDVLHHYPSSDTVEVDGVRLRAVDAAGRLTLGSAQRAVSNGDATQVRLLGEARVVREPAPGEGAAARVEIFGEALQIDTQAQRVRSDQPVTLLTGRGRLRAGSLDYSHADGIGRLGGRVTGELRPLPRTPP